MGPGERAGGRAGREGRAGGLILLIRLRRTSQNLLAQARLFWAPYHMHVAHCGRGPVGLLTDEQNPSSTHGEQIIKNMMFMNN